jgi:hypothetical protein
LGPRIKSRRSNALRPRNTRLRLVLRERQQARSHAGGGDIAFVQELRIAVQPDGRGSVPFA